MKKSRVKINHDYFSLNTKVENLKSFIQQGNILSHIIDRVKWHYFPRFSIVSSFPTHLEIEVSSACQMRCPMCKTTEMTNSGIKFAGIMDFDLYKKIINESAGESLYSVKLSWRGEPLLNHKIVEMVSYTKDKGIKDVAFLTNGELLSEKMVRRLVDANLDWISVSFDGMGEAYNKIRMPAIFEETIEKVRYIRQYRDKVKRKKPLIRVQSIHSAIRGKESEFLKLWEGIADRVNFIADQKRSINTKDYRHDPFFLCPSPWQRMCISWDGKVVQCYGDYMESNILGNIKEKSLKEIWRDRPFNELRRLIKNFKRLATKPCQTCADGGKYKDSEIKVGNRKVKIINYENQMV